MPNEQQHPDQHHILNPWVWSAPDDLLRLRRATCAAWVRIAQQTNDEKLERLIVIARESIDWELRSREISESELGYPG